MKTFDRHCYTGQWPTILYVQFRRLFMLIEVVEKWQELKSNWSFCLKITTKLLQRFISYIYELHKYSVSTCIRIYTLQVKCRYMWFKFGAQCFNHKQMQVSKIQEHFGRNAFKTSSGSIWALVTNMLAVPWFVSVV